MEKVISEGARRKAALTMGPDSLEAGVRGRIRTWIEELVEAELTAGLGAEVSARPGATRQGYRHGHRERTLGTSLGPTTFQLPRARLQSPTGAVREWQSVVVPRYQRRTGQIDEALLGVYLSGTNGRRHRPRPAPTRRRGGQRGTRPPLARPRHSLHRPSAYPAATGARRHRRAASPARWREELTEDYRRMIYSRDAVVVRLAAQRPDQAARTGGVSRNGGGDRATRGVITRRMDAH
jgi:hypothetical protein